MSSAPELRPLTEQSATALRAVQAHGCLTSIELRNSLPNGFVQWSGVLSNLNRTGLLQCRPRTDPGRPIIYTLTDRGRAWLASNAADGAVRANRNTLGSAAPPLPAPALFVPRIAPPLTYRPTGTYQPARDAGLAVIRPGAQDALNLPSRRADGLHWRDGRFERQAA